MNVLNSDLPESEATVTSTVSIILDSQPSCLEFAKSHGLLVVGTYNLESGQATGQDLNDPQFDIEVETPAQERTGSLLVFRVTEQRATLLQTTNLPYAVLDLHFSPKDPSIFAVATSIGTVCLFSIDYEHDGFLTLAKTISVADGLVLSLAYRIPRPADESCQIAASISDGHLRVLFEDCDEQSLGQHIPAHSQEAWTVAWSNDLPHPNRESITQYTLYSGGDDSALLKYSTGIQPSSSRDDRTHGAGVTAIVVLPFYHEGHEILITGSYDEHVRVLVPPKMGRGRANVLAEERLGGGVWRLSRPYAFDPAQRDDDVSFNMLASCMHAGARILKVTRTAGTWSIKVVAKFTEHESMNYASDLRESEKGTLFVSTSFYDRKLCVWSLRNVSGC